MGKKEKGCHFEWLKRKSRGGHAGFITFPGDRSVAYSSPSTAVQVSPWHTTLCMYRPGVTSENEAASPPAASSLPSSSWKWGKPQNHRKSGITHSGLEQLGFSNYSMTAWNWQTRCILFSFEWTSLSHPDHKKWVSLRGMRSSESPGIRSGFQSYSSLTVALDCILDLLESSLPSSLKQVHTDDTKC